MNVCSAIEINPGKSNCEKQAAGPLFAHDDADDGTLHHLAELAHLIGYIDQDLVDYHRSLLASMGLPTSWNGGSFDDVLALMHRDKKARGNELRFVVLDEIGHVVHLDNPPAEAVEEAFRRIQQ